MSTDPTEERQDPLLLLPPPVRRELDLNTAADPMLLWGRVAAEENECWADFYQRDPECCEHNWPPLDEDEPQCLGCGLAYADWSE
ncbi:hypothetical protein [Micromonospora sp. NPDC049240]|uniref:hypothetical protein n=1 Tax=Micromonospora sp. NPDC049240 TaxID=3155151 RepID=UPI0033D75BFF